MRVCWRYFSVVTCFHCVQRSVSASYSSLWTASHTHCTQMVWYPWILWLVKLSHLDLILTCEFSCVVLVEPLSDMLCCRVDTCMVSVCCSCVATCGWLSCTWQQTASCKYHTGMASLLDALPYNRNIESLNVITRGSDWK